MGKKAKRGMPERSAIWDKKSQRLRPDLRSSQGRFVLLRGLLRWFTWVSLTGLVLVLLLLVWQMLVSWKTVPELRPPPAGLRLVITGQSSLQEDQIAALVQPLMKPKLEAVRAFRVKAVLESRGQIKHVRVEKAFPDELRIHVTERLPVLMAAIQDAGNQVSFWAIDEAGVLFKPFDPARMQALELPFVEGIRLDVVEDGVTRVAGIERVRHLLALLQHEAYEVFQDLRSVSLESFSGGEAELGAVIILRGRKLRKIVFGVENFEYQIVKLHGVLSVGGRLRLQDRQIIDLSLSGDAIVR
jgi:hypothetical protein